MRKLGAICLLSCLLCVFALPALAADVVSTGLSVPVTDRSGGWVLAIECVENTDDLFGEYGTLDVPSGRLYGRDSVVAMRLRVTVPKGTPKGTTASDGFFLSLQGDEVDLPAGADIHSWVVSYDERSYFPASWVTAGGNELSAEFVKKVDMDDDSYTSGAPIWDFDATDDDGFTFSMLIFGLLRDDDAGSVSARILDAQGTAMAAAMSSATGASMNDGQPGGQPGGMPVLTVRRLPTANGFQVDCASEALPGFYLKAITNGKAGQLTNLLVGHGPMDGTDGQSISAAEYAIESSADGLAFRNTEDNDSTPYVAAVQKRTLLRAAPDPIPRKLSRFYDEIVSGALGLSPELLTTKAPFELNEAYFAKKAGYVALSVRAVARPYVPAAAAPKTGDGATPLLWAAVALAACAGFAFTLRARRAR